MYRQVGLIVERFDSRYSLDDDRLICLEDFAPAIKDIN